MDNPILFAWLVVMTTETFSAGARVCIRAIRGKPFRAVILLPRIEPIVGVVLLTLVSTIYATFDPPWWPRWYFAAWIVMGHIVISIVCELVVRRFTRTIRSMRDHHRWLEHKIALLERCRSLDDTERR